MSQLIVFPSFLGVTVCLFLVNIAQIASIPLYFLNRTAFYHLHTYFGNFIWSLLQKVVKMTGLEYEYVAADPIPIRENAFIISNHQSFMDVFAIHGFSQQKRMLGYCKYFMKVLIRRF